MHWRNRYRVSVAGPTAASPYVQVLRTRERRERTGSPPPARPRRRKVAIGIVSSATADRAKHSSASGPPRAWLWAIAIARAPASSSPTARGPCLGTGWASAGRSAVVAPSRIVTLRRWRLRTGRVARADVVGLTVEGRCFRGRCRRSAGRPGIRRVRRRNRGACLCPMLRRVGRFWSGPRRVERRLVGGGRPLSVAAWRMRLVRAGSLKRPKLLTGRRGQIAR